ncbi:hypothetical protein [Micromonospora sp. NBC_01392]|uniref:PIN-like domain-containing protein n=1 Tax=Micromonospora sp. NBC_01392 TaxID=2903588 RepID=UPI0038700732
MLLSRIRSDVTYPGDPGGEVHRRFRPPCVVTDVATPDDVWIPQVTEQGFLIVTRDRHIRTRPREIAAVRGYGARMVALTAAGQARSSTPRREPPSSQSHSDRETPVRSLVG